jgi:GT2 family glycosyltransferase
MSSGHSIFAAPHHQSLELMAVDALARGNAVAAFRLADRRCRIAPPPEAHSLVLRADASLRMGDRAAAVTDIARALRLAPDDLVANRRMLRWARGRAQLRAATALIAIERNPAILNKAVGILYRGGFDAIANLAVLHDAIEGWAAWRSDHPLELTIFTGEQPRTWTIESERCHPFRIFGQAASFLIPRPKSTEPQLITLSAAGRSLSSRWVAANAESPPTFRPSPCEQAPSEQRVTVVVPVYGNYNATRTCLTGLLEILRLAHHVLLVDDATPDPRIASYLTSLSTSRSVTLLRNPKNLGFVASVNRALGQLTSGDVVLLNADTIVPADLLDRLVAVARSSSDIGTIIPLSNNGDLASFPIPYQSNPLGTSADVGAIDTIAAKANPGAVVDIPNGVGYCMYITRQCLDAVGLLSADFSRGYLEDVDFCLRARAHGFRNVCAPSIYVGHAGGKSFGNEKRSLVVRNLDVLKTRFPDYRAQFAAFCLADPLRPYREAIERKLVVNQTRHRLLITGPGTLGAVARERARKISSTEEPALLLEPHRAGGERAVKITDSSGRSPQSVQFALASPGDTAALRDYLTKLRLSGAEIFDPARLTGELVKLLLELGVSFDLFLADAGLFGGADIFAIAAARSASQAAAGAATHSVRRNKDQPRAHHALIEAANRILVPCRHAAAFARACLHDDQLGKVERLPDRRRQPRLRRPPGHLCRIGFVPLRSGAHEYRLIEQIARIFCSERPDVSFTVIGATLDDLGLMRIGNTFVTGGVGPADFTRMVKAHALQCLFVSVCRPLFGHELQSLAINSPLPVAYFDWSKGHATVRQGDLPIDPKATIDGIVSALRAWMAV